MRLAEYQEAVDALPCGKRLLNTVYVYRGDGSVLESPLRAVVDRLGDMLDCWRVESIDPGQRLRPAAEMKLPGRAWLDFKVRPDASTPPWLSFRIVTPPPIAMRAGTLIDYKLRGRGLPLRWRTLIQERQPPHRFVDEQVRGPYRQWIHTHTFEPRDGGTLARDHVGYAVPVDFLTHRRLVRPDIGRIFAFRQEALRRRFGGTANGADGG